MNKLEATYNNEIIYIHYVSDDEEYCLVSYSKDETRKFKLNTVDIGGINKEQLVKFKLSQDGSLKGQIG